ncbi:MAG TPA: ATP-binding protein [Chryseolinea sp.]|jgi:signal transduction histidine kinase|nr:ATP-binding protein [Chryseolinea sp.]
MTLDFNPESKLTFNRFSKLGAWYIFALSIIATVAIVGQFLIQDHLQDQLSDSRVVNLAGSQRYKSQGIVKMSLLLYTDIDHKHFPEKIKTLSDLLEQWKAGHYGLQHGNASLNLPDENSEKVMAMFRDLEPYFKNVYNSANHIIEYKKGNLSDTIDLRNTLTTLLDNEAIFLKKMDKIVFQYDAEAREKVSTLSKLEYVLIFISIVVILLEIVFVFRPTTVQVNKTVNQLITSEKNAKQLSKEIGALYTSLEKSYEQISHINLPVENPRLFAKADRGGNITFVTDLLEELSKKEIKETGMPLSQLFEGMEDPGDWMDEVVETVSEGNHWQGEVFFHDSKGGDCWIDLTITPVYNEQNDIEELLILGTDLTMRKQAERNMNVKSRAEIEKTINRQKFRSVLILEGQEEERKRIAMDIHDGIGQMLTSLKFQIESINLKESEKAQSKISEIDLLIKQIIKEVRKVTFNLKPTVLGDYGLQAALNVFIQEIGKLIDIKLIYKTEGELYRLPQKIENNIFRIIQEAINNAIKYSEADLIEVFLQQSENDLIITVKDAGKGFDPKIVEARSVNIESGRGFFNMYERTEYVNGRLEIISDPGKGTTVQLIVPMRTAVLVD